MPKHSEPLNAPIQFEAPEDTPPVEANPTEPAPTPETDVDPKPEPDDAPPIKPGPEPSDEERPVPKGDKPIESLPMGSTEERAVTYVSKIKDEDVRLLLMGALGDRKVFSQDEDLRHRMMVADNLREMIRYIRTNVPASASFKTFMEGINSYLLMVENQGIPSMWSEEAANAPLDEIQARKAAMAIERAAESLVIYDGEKPGEALKHYAKQVREGKIK